MAAYHQVYGFGHLWVDCQGRDKLRNPTLVSNMGLPVPVHTGLSSNFEIK